MGQNRRARRRDGTEQQDAEERRLSEQFVRQAQHEGRPGSAAYADTHGEVLFDQGPPNKSNPN